VGDNGGCGDCCPDVVVVDASAVVVAPVGAGGSARTSRNHSSPASLKT